MSSDRVMWHEMTKDERMDFRQSDLREANLYWANLRGANLNEVNLCGSDLRDANLNGTNLNRANLRGASLSGASLSGASLSGASLSGANLSEVDLSAANLSGANLPEFSIDLGLRRDGWSHHAHLIDGEIMIHAGICRKFTLNDAREHWSNHKRGKDCPLCAESLAKLDMAERIAKNRGWL